MQTIQKWPLLNQATFIYVLSIVLTVATISLWGRLYVMVFNSALPPHMYTIGFANVIKGFIFGYTFFLSLGSFLILIKKRVKILMIGLLPFLLILYLYTLWAEIVIKHFFGVLVIVIIAWLLAQGILFVKKVVTK